MEIYFVSFNVHRFSGDVLLPWVTLKRQAVANTSAISREKPVWHRKNQGVELEQQYDSEVC